ncbi:DNA glycosylase AlkZ-like family protein [Nocardioides sp. zg-1228]|uniref:DNA glycosylase AlkZ-like family protein n=1 Tax=Nocardioides sp. zg-1228 TaxID=2763008 RepID=UPI0016427093|nr:crosslink repair DNA glycosylase YcaQ family protein [Nocardioides sp. zg-1228]MBC2934624.1 YcaQ family DNA glycosylase [Nocardioides sp. zg-1228]QSF59371.1 YcaQ family DNA glycosylase [Nocardioides sp. zg-1228]
MGARTGHDLTPQQARRIAVRAQLLAEPRPDDVLDVVRHLGFLQVDLTRVVAPHADLALWTRLGGSYEPEDLEDLVGDGALVEVRGMLLPSEDVALLRADMDAWPGDPPLKEWQEDLADWVAANDGCRRDILALLRSEGPTPARDLPDTCEVPWRSTGWTNDKNVMKLLECMEGRGEVAVASREGRERRWDLAERVHPGDPAVPAEEAHRTLARRRLRALGIARPRALEAWDERYDVRDTGEPARVEGVRGQWRVDPDLLVDLDDFAGRTAILSPLDRVVFDRKRMEDLFAFDYQLEMYKPAAKRQWGYWAMPVLDGEDLVGKVDATAERDAGVLVVDAVHEDGSWSAARRRRVEAEIAALGEWLGLEVVRR